MEEHSLVGSRLPEIQKKIIIIIIIIIIQRFQGPRDKGFFLGLQGPRVKGIKGSWVPVGPTV